jgi:hypothetical protein
MGNVVKFLEFLRKTGGSYRAEAQSAAEVSQAIDRESLVRLELDFGASFLRLFDAAPLPEQKDLALRNANISRRIASLVVGCLDAKKGEELEPQIESLAEGIQARQGHLAEDVNDSSSRRH